MTQDYHHNNDNLDNLTSLAEAISKLQNSIEVEKFLIDLCTPTEIRSFEERWRVCQLLNMNKYSYRQIKELTGASTTTIGRVARFLNDEIYQGYKTLLKKLEREKNVEKINNHRGNAM